MFHAAIPQTSLWFNKTVVCSMCGQTVSKRPACIPDTLDDTESLYFKTPTRSAHISHHIDGLQLSIWGTVLVLEESMRKIFRGARRLTRRIPIPGFQTYNKETPQALPKRLDIMKNQKTFSSITIISDHVFATFMSRLLDGLY